MRPGVTPHHISPLLPFQRGTRSVLETENVDCYSGPTSGIAKSGKYLWIVQGPVLEVIHLTTRRCIASWVFGITLKDTHSYVTCVKEFSSNGRESLLVGVCSSSSVSMVCVLDIQTSKVFKAFEIPHRVSSIEVITNIGGDFIPRWALNDQLRLFHGIISVGTITGNVYLIDMGLDNELYSDEVMPSKLQCITPRARDVLDRRKQAMIKGCHLCLVLDEDSHGNQFKYKRCDGTLLKSFNPDEVVVTCLKYIPQIGTLVVGFNFGSYQLWKLNVPVLEYSSRVEPENGSVLHIAYQEPENDPKNFCYLWIVRGGETQEEESIASASLYQLAYNKKTWYSNYGAFYEELTSVSLRFDLDFTATLFNNTTNSTLSSRAIAGYTLEDPTYTPPSKLNEEESFEESVHGPDLSRCLFVWVSTEKNKTTYQMAIFDMNRWYHAQMPAALRCIGSNIDTCPYLSLHSLDDAISHADNEPLLAVHIYADKVMKFINTSPLPPEQHFYPASLAFDAMLVTESGLIKGHFLGTQRQVLATMEKIGPSVLLNCKELYHTCIYMGLLPRPLDGSAHNPAVMTMRESLLTMALEYNMLPFIIKCVVDWSPGEFVHHGCTLKFLLDWAWNRVAHLKNTIDNTCASLFDWSGIGLDCRSLQTLDQAYQKLSHLMAIFKSLLNQALPTTEEGSVQLQSKLSVIMYISQYLHVVLWFVRAGLLPEHDELEENLLPGQYSYPVSNLMVSFEQRRQEFQKIHKNISDTDLLLIDGLVKEMGPAVGELWVKEGGKGQYPPPSLHALLSIYLLEGVDLMMKHALLLYCLLDLVSLVDPSQYDQFSEKIAKFTKCMSIPFSLVKQIQGFWLLDHKDFEESMMVLLHPLVTSNIGEWQHYRIIKALLYQGDCKMALRYISSKQPSLSTPEEVKIKMTVLLANGLTSDALEYQRTFRDDDNMVDLLQHLFLGCQQTKTIDQLLQLPLTTEEELQLIRYLTDSKEPNSQELLVLHFLQRSRYVEAVQLNEKLKHAVSSEPNAKARERAAGRNAMVDGYLSVLSSAQRKLVYENHTVLKKNTAKRREVRKPQPLSTSVTKKSMAKIVSRTSLFLEILEKVQEIRTEEEEDQDTSFDKDEPAVEPFVGTPITPRARSMLRHSQPVVYMTEPENINLQKSLPWQPSAQAALTPFNLTKMMSPVSNRRTSKIVSADALSMLQTPVPQRKSFSKMRTPTSSVPATPQSILKVRQLLSRSPQSTPPTMSMTKAIDLEESIAPSAPGTPRSVSFLDTNVQGTPKQLRFAEPKTDETTVNTPTVSKGQRSILRSPPSPKSVKDRSPTPESISRSPKHKATLDLLQRKPLYEEGTEGDVQQESDMESPLEGAESTDTADETMETEVHVDNEITFNFTRSGESEDEGMDSSTEPIPTQKEDIESEDPLQDLQKDVIDQSNVEIHTTNQTQSAQAPPRQISSLKKSAIMTSPVKLKHSPLKVATPPRSPTIKLTKSPARGIFQPKFSLMEDEQVVDQPIETSVRKEEPIEIDDTDEECEDANVKKVTRVSFQDVNDQKDNVEEVEDSLEEKDQKEKTHVSFKDIDDKNDSIHEVDDSFYSDDNLEEKINEIENRIYDFAQPEEIENDNIEEAEVKSQNFFKKRERSVAFTFAVPDSSSDSGTNNPVLTDKQTTKSSEAEIVEPAISSTHTMPESASEDAMVKDYSNFVSSLAEDIENQPDQSKGDLEEEIPEKDEKSAADKLDEKSNNADMPPLMEIEEDCFENKQLPEVEDENENEEESGDESQNAAKKYPLRKTEARISVSSDTPSKRSSRRLSSISKSEDVNDLHKTEPRRSSRRVSGVLKYDEALLIPSQTSPTRKSMGEGESDNDKTKSPGRRSSRRVSGVVKYDQALMIPTPKSPTRKSGDESDRSKSPARRKSILKETTVIDNTESGKSPARKGRKSVQPSEVEIDKKLEDKDDDSEPPKTPTRGRKKKTEGEDQIETVKSPGRRTSMAGGSKSPGRRTKVKDTEVSSRSPSPSKSKSKTKSPGRKSKAKVNEVDMEIVEDSTVTKSPGRRKSVKNVTSSSRSPSPSKNETKSKSPGRRKSILKNQTVDMDSKTEISQSVEGSKSPSRSRSTKSPSPSKDIVDASQSKSPSRRKSSMKKVEPSPTKIDIDIESVITKSPSRSRRSLQVDTETSEVVKSPSRRKSILKDSTKSPSRKKNEETLQGNDDDITTEIVKSPGRRKSILKDATKSPSRKKNNETIVENDKDLAPVSEQQEEIVQVKKSPGRPRKKVTNDSIVKSPSRTRQSKASQALEVKGSSSEETQEQSDEGILTPPESEMDSPNTSKKVRTPTRGRRGRTSTTPSRKSKKEEEEMIIEEEPEAGSPVYSFSDPMQVDVPSEDFTKVKAAADVHSFIFSPPVAARTRHSEESSKTVIEENNILLPRETTPARSREGTPVKSTSRGRRKKEPDVSMTIPIPEEPPGMEEEEEPVEREPPAKKEKRTSRRGKKKLLNYDEVILISPIKEEEGETEPEKPTTRHKSKRDQEMPINLRGGTLMTTRSRKKRAAKLW